MRAYRCAGIQLTPIRYFSIGQHDIVDATVLKMHRILSLEPLD